MRNTSCSFGVSALSRNIHRCGIKLRVTPLSGLYRRMFMNVKVYRHGTCKATTKCDRDLWTILKLDESPFQNPKSEIRNLKMDCPSRAISKILVRTISSRD